MNPPPLNPEMLVRTEDLIAARAEVDREGWEAALQRLQTGEPVLMQFLIETWNEVYRQLRRLPQSPEHCMFMRKKMTHALIVALTAQRKSNYRLWRDTAIGTLLAKIDPDLAR
jgi:hypothetical protein